jgi:hypothetical protein
MRRFRIGVVLAAVVMLMAVAAPGNASKPDRYDLFVPDGQYGTTVVATVGDTATVRLSGDTSEFEYWRVRTQCTQDGTRVLHHYARFDGQSAEIPLGPTRLWTSGPADCTAELGYFRNGVHTRWRVVSKASFHALDPDGASDLDSTDDSSKSGRTHTPI